MKGFIRATAVLLLAAACAAPAPRDARSEQIDQLFAQLKSARSEADARRIEASIQQMWLNSGKAEIDAALAQAIAEARDYDFEAALSILDDLKQQGITLLVATHDLNQAAEQYPKIILLNRALMAYGPPETVLTPAILGRAYGGHVHVVHDAERDLLITDSCCDEGHAPVEPILTLHAHDAPPTPERIR